MELMARYEKGALEKLISGIVSLIIRSKAKGKIEAEVGSEGDVERHEDEIINEV